MRNLRLPPEPIPHTGWTVAISQAFSALRHGGRTVLLIGPPGTGKTMLLRQVARLLEADGTEVEMLTHAGVPLPPSHNSVGSPGSRRVLVDEADHLNLDDTTIVLKHAADGLMLAGVAFSEATENLLPTDTLRVALEPLPKEEVPHFLAAHLALKEQPSDLFTAEAVERLADHSEGILRLIVSLADASAWLAGMNASPHITAKHVDEAAMLRRGKGFQDVDPLPMEASSEAPMNVSSTPADKPSLKPSLAEAWHHRQAPVLLAAVPERILSESLPAAPDEPAGAAAPARQFKRRYALVPAVAACIVALSAFLLQGVTQHGQSELAASFEEGSQRPPTSVVQIDNFTPSASESRPDRQANAPPQPNGALAGGTQAFPPDPPQADGTVGPAIGPGPAQFGLAASELRVAPEHPASTSPQPLASTENADLQNAAARRPVSSDLGRTDPVGPSDGLALTEARRRANEAELIATPTPSSHTVAAEALSGVSESPPGPSPAEGEERASLDPTRRERALNEARNAQRTPGRANTTTGEYEPFSRPVGGETSRPAQGNASSVNPELVVMMPLPPRPPVRMPDINRAATSIRPSVVPDRAVTAQGRSLVRREAAPLLSDPGERCRIASFRFQLGRPLSQADRDFVRQGCRPS